MRILLTVDVRAGESVYWTRCLQDVVDAAAAVRDQFSEVRCFSLSSFRVARPEFFYELSPQGACRYVLGALSTGRGKQCCGCAPSVQRGALLLLHCSLCFEQIWQMGNLELIGATVFMTGQDGPRLLT